MASTDIGSALEAHVGRLAIAATSAAHQGPKASPAALAYVDASVSTTSTPEIAATILGFWLGLHRESAALRERHLDQLSVIPFVPKDLIADLRQIGGLAAPVIPTYAALAQRKAKFERNLGALRRAEREFSLLKPLNDAIAERDLKGAKVRLNDFPGGNDSPTLATHRALIDQSLRALQALDDSNDVPIIKLPSEWIADRSEWLFACAGLTPFVSDADRAKIQRALSRIVREGLARLDRSQKDEASVWLESLGLSVEVALQSAVQRTPRGEGRRRTVVRAPATPTHVEQVRSFTPAEPRCRMCGVNRPDRGNVCYSCADMRD